MNEQADEGEGRVWLERGIQEARAGRHAEARQALFRALNDESQREVCWLWLAAVSDDAQQERVYLKKVLTLNPGNRFARAGLRHLDARTGANGSGGQPAGASILGVLDGKPDPEPAAGAEAEAGVEPEMRAEPKPRINVAAQPPVEAEAKAEPHVRGAERAAAPVRSTVEAPPAVVRPQSAPSKSRVAAPVTREPNPVRTTERPKATPAAAAPVEAEKPVAPPRRPSGKQASGEGVEAELSGWTTRTKRVPPKEVRPPAESQTAEVSGWSRSLGKAAPAEQKSAPTGQPQRVQYEIGSVAVEPIQKQSGWQWKLVLSEAFQCHETWTVMAATLSLAGLAFVLFIVTVMSLAGL